MPLQLGGDGGEEVDVEAGHLLAFDAGGMQYGIKRAGGLKTMLLGGEGLFFVNIRGPAGSG